MSTLLKIVNMIYLIADIEKRWCKIGYSTNPKQRICGIQTSSPVKIEIIAVIEGTFSEESKLHNKFKKHRVSGEWFTYNTEIIEYIQAKPQVDVSGKKPKPTKKVGKKKRIGDTKPKIKLLESDIKAVKEILVNLYEEGDPIVLKSEMRKYLAKKADVTAEALQATMVELMRREEMYVIDYNVYTLGRYADRENHEGYKQIVKERNKNQTI